MRGLSRGGFREKLERFYGVNFEITFEEWFGVTGGGSKKQK